MKLKNKILLAVATVAMAVSAFADAPTYSPVYSTMFANGNAASPASVIFPAHAATTVRIVGAYYDTDTNNSVLSFTSGTTAYSIIATNVAASSVTNQINSTNGLAGGGTLVLQHGGVCYANTVSTWNATTNSGAYGGTNVVLSSGGWGVATSVGDNVYLMSSAMTLPAAAASSGTTTHGNYSGEAIYVGTLAGRPVSVTITPALVTNKLNSVTVHYD
jgi:hypothetical protein